MLKKTIASCIFIHLILGVSAMPISNRTGNANAEYPKIHIFNSLQSSLGLHVYSALLPQIILQNNSNGSRNGKDFWSQFPFGLFPSFQNNKSQPEFKYNTVYVQDKSPISPPPSTESNV